MDIQNTKSPEHGDYATNIALLAAKLLGMAPPLLGKTLAETLAADPAFLRVEVAGPGFLNFFLKPSWTVSHLQHILEAGSSFGQLQPDVPQKINVEFVSVNPNGPITIGSGRGAAYGSALCNILVAAGHTVHREYYVNDGVNSEQMRLFAESVLALRRGEPVPENGYKGDYVSEIAAQIPAEHTVEEAQQLAQDLMIEAQRTALTAFGTTFDTWFSEQSLHNRGMVSEEIEMLRAGQVADTEPIRNQLKLAKGGRWEDVEQEAQDPTQETLWLRSTKFGDDQDRVLQRRDGRLTYIASDVAYHKDKFNRPADTDRLITILGPDHHGYIGRLHAVVAAMLLAEERVEWTSSDEPLTDLETKIYRSPDERARCKAALALAQAKLEVHIYQLVRFLKDGKPAPMRKRDGNIFALIDLMREIGTHLRPESSEAEQLEVGKDVARFFYLMRSHETTFDFDLDLAQRESDENPVFYVQYAHARICSVIEKAAKEGLAPDKSKVDLLTHERERDLVKILLDLPFEIQRIAADYGVHRLTTYAQEVARAYHAFYDACRVIQPDQADLSQARLALCHGTRIVLARTLGLLGISQPERM